MLVLRSRDSNADLLGAGSFELGARLGHFGSGREAAVKPVLRQFQRFLKCLDGLVQKLLLRIQAAHFEIIDGQFGVEAQADGLDIGRRGLRLDPAGDIPPTPGKEMLLTLDADIQNRALEVMGEESGAIVVMDVRNGDLLAMVSAPSFDANRFVKGLSGAEYKALAEYERKPMLDKSLTGVFPPGSTFKPTVGLAALLAARRSRAGSAGLPG